MRTLAVAAAVLTCTSLAFAQDNGPSWAQLQKLRKDENPHESQWFGTAVALDGTTAIVGLAFPRRIVLYELTERKWTSPQFFHTVGIGWGSFLAIDGDTIVGASYSNARVYVRSDPTWIEEQRIEYSSDSVAISGDTLALGSRDDGSLVAVYVRNAGVWTLEQEIRVPNSVRDVALDGDTLVIGAYFAAYVYERSASVWSQQAVLEADDPDSSEFGKVVDLDEETAVVGHPDDDGIGAVYVFRRTGGTWGTSAVAKLRPQDAAFGDRFGDSVAISNGRIVAGAPERDHSNRIDAGAVYTFDPQGGSWSETRMLTAADYANDDQFGLEVDVDGDLVLVGTSLDDPDGLEDAGAAYFFVLGEELGTPTCDPAVPNSSGEAGVMRVLGSSVVAEDAVSLVASELPGASNIGYFIMGTGTNTFTPPGSAGPICVAPGIVRFLPGVHRTTDSPGGFFRFVGTTGPVSGAITPGSTWGFQAWHRDGAGPSNLTSAVQVVFQ